MSLEILGLVLVGLLAGAAGADPPVRGTGLLTGSNFRIYPSAITQTETFITRHPLDPSVLFASANTINLNTGFVSEGIYVSTNAGAGPVFVVAQHI